MGIGTTSSWNARHAAGETARGSALVCDAGIAIAAEDQAVDGAGGQEQRIPVAGSGICGERARRRPAALPYFTFRMIARDAPVTSSWFIWPSGRRDPMAWSVISIGSQVPVVSRVLEHVISRAIVTDERIRTASSAKLIEMLQLQQRYSAFLEPHRCWCLMLTGDTKRASRALTAGLTQVRHSKSGTNLVAEQNHLGRVRRRQGS